MSGPCGAWSGPHATVHTCDDPVICALNSVISGPADRQAEDDLDAMQEVFAAVTAYCADRKSVSARKVLRLLNGEES